MMTSQTDRTEKWGESLKHYVNPDKSYWPEMNAMRASDEPGNKLNTRGRRIEETFQYTCVVLCPPSYRSPIFPVFFYAVNRRYKRALSRFSEDEPHYVGTSSPAVPVEDPVYLAQAILEIGDRIERTDLLETISGKENMSLFRVIQSVGFSRLRYIPVLVSCSKMIFRSAARRFLHRVNNLNIFTRKNQIDQDACDRVLKVKRSQQSEYSDQIQDVFKLQGIKSESQSGSEMMELEECVTALNYSDTNTLPVQSQIPSSDPGLSERGSSCLTRSHSAPSLSPITSTKKKTFRPAESLPDLLLKSSFEEFTPEITADENDETFRLQCSRPGLYQCSVTGLVFHMDGEGDVVYRTVPWNRRLLAQHDKQPAGPLFDIKCVQQSVRQLHLPHCEIRSTAAPHFLSVAHVSDEGVEFIGPHKITETHVVIKVTGFSAFGNVRDGDSPPEPVRALVLLFYRPPADPDPESLLNVLLLPRNVVLRDVLRTRKKLVGDESYIETSPHCKLQPKQEYTLSTCPEDDSVLVQPTEAEFDSDNYDDYFPSFQVSLETVMKHIKLFLRDVNKRSVWERRVCLWSAGVKRSCGPSALNLRPNERLLNIRSSFVDGISGPVLKSLLDKLFEKTVLSDPERESAAEIHNRRDKACFVLDTVRKKGEAASSEMMEILCEEDPFLCEHLGLI